MHEVRHGDPSGLPWLRAVPYLLPLVARHLQHVEGDRLGALGALGELQGPRAALGAVGRKVAALTAPEARTLVLVHRRLLAVLGDVIVAAAIDAFACVCPGLAGQPRRSHGRPGRGSPRTRSWRSCCPGRRPPRPCSWRPPAPSEASLLEREDLLLRGVWEELVDLVRLFLVVLGHHDVL